jgi:hypothetical protein
VLHHGQDQRGHREPFEGANGVPISAMSRSIGSSAELGKLGDVPAVDAGQHLM